MQVTGVEPILYYILSILEAANITDDFDQANALVGLAAFTSVCSIIGGQLIDRQGRRQLLLMSLAGTFFITICGSTSESLVLFLSSNSSSRLTPCVASRCPSYYFRGRRC